MLMQAHIRGTGLALPAFNLGARRGSVANAIPWPLCPTEEALVCGVEEDKWTPEIIWRGRENILLHHGLNPGPSSLYRVHVTDYTISVPTQIQGVLGGIVNILGGGSMDYSE
jgi:hypothetical protein